MGILTSLQGDWRDQLKTLPDESAQCCVTSPPYWGLRDYGVPGQLGLEKTPEEYVAKIVAGFNEVKRVLRKDGTCWINLGDSYAGGGNGGGGSFAKDNNHGADKNQQAMWKKTAANGRTPINYKPKDLVGIPWLVAFALRAAGWYLRSDIIWAKPNPMPESVTDRPTKAHEYIFLLTKSQKYFYNHEAIKEPMAEYECERRRRENRNGHDIKYKIARDGVAGMARQGEGGSVRNSKRRGELAIEGNRNKRTVWTVATNPYQGAHFATFPPELISPCILAGSRPGDTVLDPFGGSGTTGMVALELGRKAILIELNPEYIKLIEQRCNVTAGLAL